MASCSSRLDCQGQDGRQELPPQAIARAQIRIHVCTHIGLQPPHFRILLQYTWRSPLRIKKKNISVRISKFKYNLNTRRLEIEYGNLARQIEYGYIHYMQYIHGSFTWQGEIPFMLKSTTIKHKDFRNFPAMLVDHRKSWS